MERPLLQVLRGAVARADGPALIAALAGRVPVEVLQLVGDGIVAALAADVAGALDLADGCALTLRGRGWPGDEELAVELEAAAGRRAWPALRPLGVDLEELSEVVEAGLGEDGGLLDLETGEVWAAAAIEYVTESDEDHPDFDDSDRWLYVAPEGSRSGYEDMEDFIATVADRVLAERLDKAIAGKERSEGSKTPSLGRLKRRNVGIASATSGGGAEPADGWQTPATGPTQRDPASASNGMNGRDVERPRVRVFGIGHGAIPDGRPPSSGPPGALR